MLDLWADVGPSVVFSRSKPTCLRMATMAVKRGDSKHSENLPIPPAQRLLHPMFHFRVFPFLAALVLVI